MIVDMIMIFRWGRYMILLRIRKILTVMMRRRHQQVVHQKITTTRLQMQMHMWIVREGKFDGIHEENINKTMNNIWLTS